MQLKIGEETIFLYDYGTVELAGVKGYEMHVPGYPTFTFVENHVLIQNYIYSISILELSDDGNDVKITRFQPAKEELSCQHQWQQYVGFTETYQYCEKCDIRK